MPRYRITFAKTEAMRFTGNLDVHRTWERTFRRGGLPLAYSEGYSPHPRLTLAAALPLGYLSEGDLLDAWLSEDLAPEAVHEALIRAAPPGLRVERVDLIDSHGPSLPAQVLSAEYVVTLDEALHAGELEASCAKLLAEAQILRQRRGKGYDLRPLIERLEVGRTSPSLRMVLAAREGATGRPEEVLLALGLDPAKAICVRKRLVLTTPVNA